MNTVNALAWPRFLEGYLYNCGTVATTTSDAAATTPFDAPKRASGPVFALTTPADRPAVGRLLAGCAMADHHTPAPDAPRGLYRPTPAASPLRPEMYRQPARPAPNRAVLEHQMSTINMQRTPTRVLSRSKVSRKSGDAATRPFTPDTSFTPDIRLESIGRPDVDRVVQSFLPLLERLVERVQREGGSSILPAPAPRLRTIH